MKDSYMRNTDKSELARVIKKHMTKLEEYCSFDNQIVRLWPAVTPHLMGKGHNLLGGF